MKANELRIGNWVYYSRQNPPINTGYYEEQFNFLRIRDIDYLHPIPLTEEWMLKFGFECDAYTTFSKQVSKYAYILISFDDYAKTTLSESVSVADHDLTIKCEYVHQLQNLYFSLTGEELTEQR
jgi:hypothetical protein